jgi:glycosyltransferase involved in cell wall biosynthesis
LNAIKEGEKDFLRDRKVALVHDFLLYWGGAEATLQVLGKMFPQAPIYTLLKDEQLTRQGFPHRKIETSFLQKTPGWLRRRHRWLLPLMPTAVEAFNLRDYDLVLSSSSAFAKGIVVKPKTTHVCYMHAPMRYVWDYHHEYLQQKFGGRPKIFTRTFLNYLRTWDRASADRADYLIANSQYTARRIQKYYRREAEVIYPPVEVEKFAPNTDSNSKAKNQAGPQGKLLLLGQLEKQFPEGFFLTTGRLAAYKRVDLLVEAFQKFKLPLVVVGEGPERKKLEKLAQGSPNIKLLGWRKEADLIELYREARAFVCATEDDFNITCVEAMAAGTPIIALRKGGVQETVIEGQTGVFFDEPHLELVADGVRRFMEQEDDFDSNSQVIQKRAGEFSRKVFEIKMKDFLSKIG